ncbi:hypothetical protein I4F81_009726 [Pyropia yezoensis]|uniref:Uncharacterized protein n=1 Tax=Pyropia yezoensis TaxID=2788 RepID=A0ACC3CB90_PYRYE|nr:hypothetical protein I4F81_009726 [Neopyropia yezoensis]
MPYGSPSAPFPILVSLPPVPCLPLPAFSSHGPSLCRFDLIVIAASFVRGERGEGGGAERTTDWDGGSKLTDGGTGEDDDCVRRERLEAEGSGSSEAR